MSQTLLSDMVTCGNKIVREYIFSTKQRSHNDEDEKDCQPACTRWSFDLRQITVPWFMWPLDVHNLTKIFSIVIVTKMVIDIFVESGNWPMKKSYIQPNSKLKFLNWKFSKKKWFTLWANSWATLVVSVASFWESAYCKSTTAVKIVSTEIFLVAYQILGSSF